MDDPNRPDQFSYDTFSLMNTTFVVIAAMGLLFCVQEAHGTISISTSATMGYYRDSANQGHVPLYYNLGYSGEHGDGVESSFDLILNNDFSDNNWSVIPSQALLVYPLSKGFSATRRSRIQIGRQFFAEGFDLCLLDGAQLPIYWSKGGGLWFYGGNSHVMDLLDPGSSPLAGGTVFQEILGTEVKLGYSGRGNSLSERVYSGSLFRQWDDFFLSPQLIVKGELSDSTGQVSQSLEELLLSPADNFSVSFGYSLRQPRPIHPNQSLFLYRVIALSAQQTGELSANWQMTKDLSLQALGRLLQYNSGYQTENGSQFEGSISWLMTPHQSVSPFFDHIRSYGGELWDSGLLYKFKASDTTDYRLETAAAYFNKVNNIIGWAYDLRTGLNFQLASRLSAMTWIELESNPLYEFDGRVIANVTFFD